MTIIQQKQLFEEIDILPIELKTKLIEKLLDSLNKTDKSIESLWIKEINRRREEIESNRVSLIDGEEVFQKILQRFN